MIKAKDIMVREVLTVSPDTPISIAVKILVIRRLTGMPVVNESLELLGIISEKDIMGLLLEGNDLEGKKVFEFMTKEVHSFGPDDSVEEVCEFLMHKPFRRVPIVKEGKLVGIISRRDIITLIYKKNVIK